MANVNVNACIAAANAFGIQLVYLFPICFLLVFKNHPRKYCEHLIAGQSVICYPTESNYNRHCWKLSYLTLIFEVIYQLFPLLWQFLSRSGNGKFLRSTRRNQMAFCDLACIFLLKRPWSRYGDLWANITYFVNSCPVVSIFLTTVKK